MSTATSTPTSASEASKTQAQKKSPAIIIAWVIGILAAVALGLVLAALAFITFAAPGAVQSYLTQKTGFAVHSGQFSIDAVGGAVTLKDFGIDNSTQFGGGSFIKIPALNFKADLISFTRQPYHINDISLHLAEVTIVDNGNGITNAKSFADALTPTTQNQQQTQQQNTPAPKITIDHLLLQVDSIKMVNLKTKSTSTIPLNFKFERNNVTDINALKSDLTTAAMAKLGPVAISMFGNAALGSASQATHMATKGLKTGADSASKAASSLKNLFK